MLQLRLMGTTFFFFFCRYLFINQGIVWPDGMERHVLLVKLAMSPVQSCITSQFLVMSTHIYNGWTLLGYNLFSLVQLCVCHLPPCDEFVSEAGMHSVRHTDVLMETSAFLWAFGMTAENQFDAHKHNLLWSVLASQVHNIIISISLCCDMHKNKLSEVRQMRKESKLFVKFDQKGESRGNRAQ